MKNTTKQKRKRRTNPDVSCNGKITGRIGWSQGNKMISTLRRLIASNFSQNLS